MNERAVEITQSNSTTLSNTVCIFTSATSLDNNQQNNINNNNKNNSIYYFTFILK